MKRKISFDFDSTLNTPTGILYATELIKRGYEIIILTSRPSDDYALIMYSKLDYNKDLVKLVNELGITEVHYTNYADKSEFLDNLNVIFHLDDDNIEIELIVEHCKTPGFDFYEDEHWKEKCEELLGNI